MMILPLADALQNCFQNLTSRIAGIDNEQMTNRVIGMGAMLGFGVNAIKEQFNTPSSKTNNSNNNSENGGLKGFINRAKSVVSPSMNLSPETDYNGNTNPIRTVLPKENTTTNNNVAIPTSNGKNAETISNGTQNTPKSIGGKALKTGFKATKAYLSMGAKMVEGDFNKHQYKNNKSNYQNVEYVQNIQKLADENNAKKLGDKDEPKG